MESVKPCFAASVRLKTITSSQAKEKSTATPQRKPTKKELRCPVCDKLCASNSELEIHIRKHTGERPFGCTVCNKRFKSQQHANRHFSSIHCNSRPFSCIWCDKSFKFNHLLKVHIRMHTKEKPHFCTKCPDGFFSLKALTKHVLCKHNSVVGKNIKCEYCSKMFSTTSLLQIHRRIHTGEKSYTCSVCGKSFSLKGSLVRHAAVHSESRPFKCTKCPKTFRLKPSLHRHTLIVHEKRRPFPCELCGQTFSTKGNRDMHINSHLNEKPYQCPKCPKRFARPHSVVYHVKAFHENKRDFKCAECPRCFVDNTSIDIHFLRKHANPNERPLACLFCSKKYCKPNELESHLRCHLGEKPYFCTICSFSSGRNFDLKRHLRSMH